MRTRSRPGEGRRAWLGEGIPEYVSYEVDLQGLDDEALGFLQAEDVQVGIRLHDGHDTAMIDFPASTSDDIKLTIKSIDIMLDVISDLRRDLLDRLTTVERRESMS